LSGVTSNPWNEALTPGGSSGGAAVAAATGAGALHFGTDGGGSIRIPASFCGIVGLKPSFGRVAAFPASAFGTLAHIGPITRTIEDAKLMLDAMAGRDPADWNQPPFAYPRRDLQLVTPRGLKIGYWRQPPCGGLDGEVAAACDAALHRLEQAGAHVEPLALPDLDLLGVFNTLWLTGAARRLRLIDPARLEQMDPGLREAAARVAGLSAADYVDASIRRAEFGAWMEAVFARLDLIVSPATAIAAFEKAHDVPPGSGLSIWTEWAGFSFPINLSQQPACVTPCGPTADRRPIGLQFVGPRGEDDRVLELARACCQVL
jgi:amidase/aspartyl-tRNA(Asn)/glutamyl-tRNA(Gln) amidotransferase subunit A